MYFVCNLYVIVKCKNDNLKLLYMYEDNGLKKMLIVDWFIGNKINF